MLNGSFEDLGVFSAAAPPASTTTTVTPTTTTAAPTTTTTTEPPANKPPVAAITLSKTAGRAPLKIAVDARKSTDADGQIVSYGWDWGDGTPSGSGARATHWFLRRGVFTVRLTVTDNNGAWVTTSQNVTIR